jgi:hypothetical protein
MNVPFKLAIPFAVRVEVMDEDGNVESDKVMLLENEEELHGVSRRNNK